MKQRNEFDPTLILLIMMLTSMVGIFIIRTFRAVEVILMNCDCNWQEICGRIWNLAITPLTIKIPIGWICIALLIIMINRVRNNKNRTQKRVQRLYAMNKYLRALFDSSKERKIYTVNLKNQKAYVKCYWDRGCPTLIFAYSPEEILARCPERLIIELHSDDDELGDYKNIRFWAFTNKGYYNGSVYYEGLFFKWQKPGIILAAIEQAALK